MKTKDYWQKLIPMSSIKMTFTLGILAVLSLTSIWIASAIYNNAWPYLNYNNKNWVKDPDTAQDIRFAAAATYNWVSAIKDNFTNLYWEASPSTSTFAWSTNTSYWEPTWNGTTYTGTNWSATNYPAFGRCTWLWNWWRLPTINELYTLASYTLKNTNNAYTAHPALVNTTYFSSTQHGGTTAQARRFNFSNGISNKSTKAATYRVVCIHD